MIFYRSIDESVYSDIKNIHKNEHEAAMELLSRAAEKEYGMGSLPEILIAEKGKPYFKDCGIFFSISHTRGLAVCALSEKEIGADCEEDIRMSGGAARKVFSEEEKAFLANIPDEEKLHFFTKLWTVKEAYCKAIGTGILSGLSGITLMDRREYGGLFFGSFEVFSGGKKYIVSAAAEDEKSISEKPREIIF